MTTIHMEDDKKPGTRACDGAPFEDYIDVPNDERRGCNRCTDLMFARAFG